MRVCLVTSAPLPPEEGLGHHVWNLAHQLKQCGHQVGIVTRGNLSALTTEEQEGITIWRVLFAPVYPFHVHLHGLFVNRWLAQVGDRFDLINCHTPLPPVVNTAVPIVTTFHSPMKADTAATFGFNLHNIAIRLQTPFSCRIEQALLRRSRKITAVAPWIATALEQYGIDPAQVTVTGNGVENCFLTNHIPQHKEPFVLYTGRLESSKGLLDLVAAARSVYSSRRHTNVRFVLVGKGPLLPKLQALVKRYGLQQWFNFRGYFGADRREELAQFYKKALVFVLPSHHEGLPTVLLEAMGAGLPVVATAVGGVPNVIANSENGLLVPPQAPEMLAQAICRLLDDSVLRRRLGQNARTTVVQRYSWNAIGQNYCSCYAQVLNSQG